MKILNKINPLNNIIKDEDIFKLVEKLNENYFIELHNETQQKKNKLICQITFPFLRETLYQKFLMETRAPFHMKLAVIISMSKRIIYFSLDDELKFLKRNLINSEANIIDEMKRKRRAIETIKDILEIQKDLSYNNLKILLIKEICHNFYKNKIDNLLEGNIEFFSETKSDWIPVFYLINTKNIIFYNLDDEKKEKDKRKQILFFGLNSIFKNEIIKDYDNDKRRNIILEISISEDVSQWVPGINNNPRRKINYYFSSERMKDLYQLEIGINFLKMKVNYDQFADYYGRIKFPLYKSKWFVAKEEKYYFDRENILSVCDDKDKILGQEKKNNYISIEKLLDQTKRIKKPFDILFKTSLGCFLGIIQKNISNFGKSNYKNNKNNNDKKDLAIQIPNHIQKSLNNLYTSNLSMNKNNSNSSNNSLKNNDSLTMNNSIQVKPFNKLIENKEINEKEIKGKYNDENISNNIEEKEKRKSNLKKKSSFINELQSIKIKEENLNLESNIFKTNDINLNLNNIPNKKSKLTNKYSEFINKKSKVSFPKKPDLSMIKKKEEEDEPIFTESNYNTNNKNNISIQGENLSTKFSVSSNQRILEDKNNNNEASAVDSLLGLNNSHLSKNPNNSILKAGLKENKHSRNMKKNKLINRSVENDFYDKISQDDEYNKKRKKLEVKSYDNIYDNNIKFEGDFVPFKEKDKLMYKHVNIISKQDSNKDLPILKVFPSFKFENINYSKYFNYKKLSNDPKYMYIDYYQNNRKIHKSNIFDLPKKNKIK